MGQDSVADGVKGKVKGYDDSLGQNASDMAKKAPIVGKGYSTISGAVDKFGSAKDVGDIAAASGQLVQDGAGFVAGAAVDVASFAVDPIGWLVSNGLNMLIELVQPLQDALHFVTGDGPGLKRASENFTEIGKGFVTLADQFVKDGDEALKDWQGEGGDAAKKALAQFSQGIKGIGTAAGAVADTKTRGALFGQALKETAESVPKKLYEETAKEVTGASPGDLSKGPGSQGKAAYKMGNKIVDYAKNPSVGDGESTQETRDNLDMGE